MEFYCKGKMFAGLSRSGLPIDEEYGGGYTNIGEAQIIASWDGGPKKAIYVRRRGELACRTHAFIPIKEGDWNIFASHHRGDFNITVSRYEHVDHVRMPTHELGWKIDRMDEHNGEATVVIVQKKEVYNFKDGEWDIQPPAFLNAAIEAAKKKARCYHCRKPYYVKEN